MREDLLASVFGFVYVYDAVVVKKANLSVPYLVAWLDSAIVSVVKSKIYLFVSKEWCNDFISFLDFIDCSK